MKKWIVTLFFFILFILLLSSCSLKSDSFTDDLHTYLDHWKNEQFDQMYEMLSKEAKEKYDKEEFIKRYKKIYEDIGASDIKLSYIELDKKELKKIKKDKSASIPLEVEMNSVADIIHFDYDMELTYDDKNDQWAIDWDPGLIFPPLVDGGKVQIETEPQKRGEILDRNKMPLAINDIAYEIGVVPNKFKDEEAEKEEIARLLNISVSSIDKKLNESWVQDEFFVPLKVIARSDEDTLKQLEQIDAVSYEETFGRTYPSDYAISHLTGYVGKITSEEIEENKDHPYQSNDFIGKLGLEKEFEETLRGEEGIKISVIDDNKKKTVLAEKPVMNGENIQLTIDVNAQEKLYEAFDNNSGTATVIDPTSGEIIALVSSPGYDPNDFTYGITEANWDQLMNDPLEPFVNRFAATYAPGSVMKVLTASIGLENGSLKPDEALTINGKTWGKEEWNGQTITRVSTASSSVDLKDALVRSDNIYFAQQAVNMGIDQYEEGLKNFGFNEKIPLPISIKPSQISNDEKISNDLLLAHSSYGQGEVEMSSLHMALSYTPIINDGNIVKPTLLTSNKKGEVWKENVLSKDNAKIIDDNLRKVVQQGTATAINDEDFPIAGKTGTAELKAAKGSKGTENGWFVGYHHKDKDYLVSIMVERSEDIGASSYAAKLAAKVLKEIKK